MRERLESGLLWPNALIQLNPAFEPGEWVSELCANGLLHPTCEVIFRAGKGEGKPGRPVRLHRHQADTLHAAKTGENYVLTTGTGSAKSLAYILPIEELLFCTSLLFSIRILSLVLAILYPALKLSYSKFMGAEGA